MWNSTFKTGLTSLHTFSSLNRSITSSGISLFARNSQIYEQKNALSLNLRYFMQLQWIAADIKSTVRVIYLVDFQFEVSQLLLRSNLSPHYNGARSRRYVAKKVAKKVAKMRKKSQYLHGTYEPQYARLIWSNRDYFRILHIYLQYLLSYILKFLICIHARTPRVPPRVLASGPKPCGGKKNALRIHEGNTKEINF